jgi:CubicO group peptidase (beta-lactamase class C family)
MERGELRLDDPITRFLPDYPDYGRQVTVRHLLNHNSGIPSYTSMSAFSDVMMRDVSTAEVIDFFKDEPPEFPPGAQHEYSNSGYFLLGAIIEHVSSLSYGDFITREIFEPLGMKHSAYGHTRPLIPGRVSGYGWVENEWRNAFPLSMTWPGAAGGLISGIDDLLRWDNALYAEQLLSQDSLRQAWTPATLENGDSVEYGFGWAITRRDGHVGIEHGGGINGFTSYALRIPDRRLFIAVLLNSVGEIHPSVIADRIYSHALSAT